MNEGYVRGFNDLNAEDRCCLNCFDAQSCAEIQASHCPNGSDLETECDMRCRDGFVCDDGEEIPAMFRCDGYEDCVDADDEAGCGPSVVFDCGGGETIPRSDRCDGLEHCANGADKVDCAEFDFMCI